MGFGWDEARDNADTYERHEGKLSHEIVAGAAGFFAMNRFEKAQRDKGEQVSHSTAKEILAGFAAAEADKLAETKGEDFIDRERTKHRAKRNAEELYDQQYGNNDDYNPNEYEPHEHIQQRRDW